MDCFPEQFMPNVLGVVHSINAFLPLLRATAATRTAKVVSIGSAVGHTEFILACELATLAPYSVSKAALEMVVAKYAAQFKQENIIFVSLSPGLVDTTQRARKSKSSPVEKTIH